MCRYGLRQCLRELNGRREVVCGQTNSTALDRLGVELRGEEYEHARPDLREHGARENAGAVDPCRRDHAKARATQGPQQRAENAGFEPPVGRLAGYRGPLQDASVGEVKKSHATDEQAEDSGALGAVHETGEEKAGRDGRRHDSGKGHRRAVGGGRPEPHAPLHNCGGPKRVRGPKRDRAREEPPPRGPTGEEQQRDRKASGDACRPNRR
mmetsp:Transcript_80606/g.224301  ORF Transcript_80606/g.224301 Transcript_80606/m.224301 type:complete len:210 (+) Transcript_80606:996-1625(+)